MTFRDIFIKEETWHRKVIILETLHLMRTIQYPRWTEQDTATELRASIGLVSENLKLARAIRENENLCKLSRNRALKKIR